MSLGVLEAADSAELTGEPRPRRDGPRATDVAERAVDVLGWVVGVATVYGPVSVCATVATMGLVTLGRLAGHRLLTAIAG